MQQDSPNHPRDTQVKVTLAARPLLTPVAQKPCMCGHGVFTSRTCVQPRTLLPIVIDVVREASISAYPGKEVRKKTTAHRLVTKFRDIRSVCL